MPNEEMIRIVMKRIERDLSLWSQADWASIFTEEHGQRHYENVYAEELLPIASLRGETYLYGLNDSTEVSCGTAMCFAGHAVLEAGDTILFEEGENVAWACMDDQGELRNIRLRAQELLGLTYEQAQTVFHGSAGHGSIGRFKELITRETGVTFD